MTINSFIEISAMFYTITGAMIEVVGLIGKNKRELVVKQASQRWGYNSDLYESLVEQRIKAIAGFLLIIIGFTFSFISSLIAVNTFNQYYIPGWMMLMIYSISIIGIWVSVKYKIKKDINYFLIPQEWKNINNKLKKYETENEEQRVSSEEYLCKSVDSLSKRVKIKFSYISYSENFDEAVDFLSKVEVYCKNKKLNNF